MDNFQINSNSLNFGGAGGGMFANTNANNALASPALDQFFQAQETNDGLGGGINMVMPQNQGWGFNIPTMKLGIEGLSALGGLYTAFKANGLAEDRFDFAKDVTNTNLRNQIASYNTSVRDRARARGVAEGQSQEQINNYVSANSLRR